MSETKVEETKQISSEKKEPQKIASPTKEVGRSANLRRKDNNSNNRSSFGNKKGNRRPRGNKFNKRPQEFEERVVNISRVVNVVKGGRRFSFSSLVVIGDKKGRVAYGHGKAKEVPDSIKKAIKDAKRNLIRVPLVEGTIPHQIQAKFVSSNILLKPAPKGKGIIASGAVRAVVELAGYTDIVTKSLGSSNKANVVKATLKALSQVKTAKEISSLRNRDEASLR